MAIATYTTDLVTLNVLDSDATPAAVGEPTGSVAGTTIAIETDHYVAGTACIAKIYNATGIGGLGFQNATAVTVPADGAVYMWTNFLAANAISSQAAGGMQLLIGNTLANYKRFYVYGSDTIPYGGWQVNAVNPANTASATQGTPSGVWQYFGMAVNAVAAVARGYPLAWDAVRAGRGSIIMALGEAAFPANFNTAAVTNDANAVGQYNRWGIFSYGSGAYTMQGRMAFGTSGSAVYFEDSNRSIVIKNTEYVSPAFNLFEVINAASTVKWTGVSVSSLGTVSKGRFQVTDNATVNLTNCTFTDMGTFTTLLNTGINGSVFRRCETVSGTGNIGTCTFDKPSGSIGVSTPNLNAITFCTFNSKGTGHAIELTAAGDYQSIANSFSNYAATNGSTGNEAIFVNVATGIVNITLVNTGLAPTIRTAGATVNVIAGATVTFAGLPIGCDVVILSAGTSTILQQTDSNPLDYLSWAYSGTPTVDVGFIKAGYVPYYIRNLVLGSTNSSIPVSLTVDRNYS